MHPNNGRYEPPGHDRLLDPEHHVIAGASVVIPEIMVEADLAHLFSFEQRDGLIRPVNMTPSWRCRSKIVEKHFHGRGPN